MYEPPAFKAGILVELEGKSRSEYVSRMRGNVKIGSKIIILSQFWMRLSAETSNMERADGFFCPSNS